MKRAEEKKLTKEKKGKRKRRENKAHPHLAVWRQSSAPGTSLHSHPLVVVISTFFKPRNLLTQSYFLSVHLQSMLGQRRISPPFPQRSLRAANAPLRSHCTAHEQRCSLHKGSFFQDTSVSQELIVSDFGCLYKNAS